MNKEEWIRYIHDRTGISKDILENEWNENYKVNNINIYNSAVGEDNIVSADKFLDDLYDHQIIVENGVIFNNHNVFTALPVTGIQSLKGLRTVFKNKMKEALKQSNDIGYRINYNSQLATKEGINTWYGIQANPASKVYNYDIACSITARGRGTVSMNGLTLEAMMGEYRPYSVVALMDFITRASSKDIPKDILDDIPDVSEIDVLKHVLGEYNNIDYYGKDILLNKIKELSNDQRKVVYYTSNYSEFIKIPKVTEILKSLLIQQNTSFGEILKLRAEGKSREEQLAEYKKYIYLDALLPPENIKTIYEEFMRWVHHILIGYYWYEGDVDKYGEELDAPEHIFKSIQRESVILTDTDSLIFALAPYMEKIRALFSDYNSLISDMEGMDDFVLGSIVIAIGCSTITEGLDRYTKQTLITDEYRHNVSYKQEFVFRTLQTTQGAKNYIGIISIQEGIYLPKEKLDLKGLSLKKANFNKYLSERASNIAENMIAKKDTPDPVEIFTEVDRVRNEIPTLFRSRNNLDVFTVIKLKFGYNNAVVTDYRYKAVENYNILFDDKIELPGAFLICKLDLDGNEEYIQEKYPHIWSKLLQILNDRSIVSTLLSIKNKAQSMWLDEQYPEFVYEFIKDLEEFTVFDDFKKYINDMKKMYRKSNDTNEDVLNFLNKISVKNVKLSDINKIALPIDNETVPEFISDHIDLKEVGVFENLIAVLIKSMGFEVIRNNEGKKQIIHNIVSYY